MALTDDDRSSIPFEDLHLAAKTIVCGVVLSGLAFSISTSSDEGRSSINLIAVIGLPVLWFGLRSLPTDRLPADIGRRAGVIGVLVAVTFVANLVTLVPAVNGAVSAIGDLAEWGWQILLLLLAARLTSYVGADALSGTWRLLARLYGVLIAATTVYGIGLVVAFPEARDASGWPGTYRMSFDGPQIWWVLPAAVVLVLAALALGIAVLVAAVHTLGFLRAGGRVERERLVRSADPAVPETTNGGGPRLGRRGDRLVYYVDPDPPPS